MSAASGLPARRAALAAIRAVEEDGAWSNLAVGDAVADLADPRDRAFASHLAYDTLRWRDTLDHALQGVSARPLARIEPALLRILRLGAVQVLRSGVPARAAVDTSVALARETVPRRRADGAAGFVNGVLRALVRRDKPLDLPDLDVDPVTHLALATGHPAWIVADLLERYGPERTQRILDADDRAPGLTLRATGPRDALLAELHAAGIEAEPGSLPMAVRAPGADPRRLDAVRAGRAVPQDEASMQVVLDAEVQPGEQVLDLCAGPGGKSVFLAAQAGPDGRVVAVEQHPHRAALVRQVAQRVGVEVEVVVGDAGDATLLRRLVGQTPDGAGFDVVLVDAPCSGLGTGRRRPEVRWRRSPDDVVALAEVQQRLLEAAAGTLRPGGRLVYAVCTWTGAETHAVADTFGAQHPTLRETARRQLLPDTDDTDGMFVARWERKPVG